MEFIKKYKGILFLIVGLMGLIIVNIDKISSLISDTGQNDIEYINYQNTNQTNNYIVEIKGEVLNPGIYELNSESRIGDLIFAAGGTTENADLSDINQALKIYDEMIVTIPRNNQQPITNSDIVRIVVEIKGEVTYPGIYNIYYGSRVYDLVEQAGGFTENAETSDIDMARYLVDGETIIILEKDTSSSTSSEREIYVEILGEIIKPGVYLVPESYSIQDLIYEAGGVTINCDLSKVNWNTVLVLGAVIYIPSYSDIAVLDNNSGLININTANLDTLVSLPGIGDILGQRIIDYRAEFGFFLTIEDIMLVSGIKDSIYEQVKEYITV